MRTHVKAIIFVVVMLSLLISGCSINKLAVRAVASALSSGGGGTALTGDDDPDLIADALPFALKLYEILLEEDPENTGLLSTTGSGFIMYANAFVQGPAEMLTDFEYQRQEYLLERAKNLYIRGRDYILQSFELRYPGFNKALNEDRFTDAFSPLSVEDTSDLYWAGAGWLAASTINAFDIELGVGRPRAIAMIDHAYFLDPDYGKGTIDELYISMYAGLPESMGGSDEKARYHFGRAVELSDDQLPGPYVALATSLSIKNQDYAEFVEALETALSKDPDMVLESRLVSILAQRKAQWLLDHSDDFFLILSF